MSEIARIWTDGVHASAEQEMVPAGLEGKDPRPGARRAAPCHDHAKSSDVWRLDLRSGQFMDKRPAPAEVPPGLLKEVRASWDALVTEWNRMYPENPVSSKGNDDEQS